MLLGSNLNRQGPFPPLHSTGRVHLQGVLYSVTGKLEPNHLFHSAALGIPQATAWKELGRAALLPEP